MNGRKLLCAVCLLTATVMCVVNVSAAVKKIDTDPKQQLPDPDKKAPDTEKKIKVFILMGQSNMLGFGRINPENQKGTLANLTRKEGEYPHLVDDDGNWTVRNDVWYVKVTVGQRQHWLQPKGKHIGPELQFGHVMGYIHEEPVLIIEASQGNRCLGWDIMPPSSRTIKPEDHYNKWYQGWQYDDFIKDIHAVLNNLPKHFPAYEGQGYEIAGFAWWQGHKDTGREEWADTYEKNLVNLIKDLRKEFKAPKAPFVLATIAFGGWDLKGRGLTVAKAQLAVSGDKGSIRNSKAT